jgi:hypothetical protein
VMAHTQERWGLPRGVLVLGERAACESAGMAKGPVRTLVAPTLEPLPGTMLRLGLRFGASAGFPGGRAAQRAVCGQGGEQR